MSRQSRVWLLQSTGDYNWAAIDSLSALKKTDYFDNFYVASDKSKSWWHDYLSNGGVYIALGPGKDLGWSNNIIHALDYVEEDVFFMGCEDHLLVDFDAPLVDLAYGMVMAGTYGCIRLTRKPQIKTVTEYGNVLEIDKSYRYYVSLQPSIWSKSYLQKIIEPNLSSWQFEIIGSQNAKRLDLPAGVTYKTAFNYKNLIEKGKLVENPRDYVSIHSSADEVIKKWTQENYYNLYG